VCAKPAPEVDILFLLLWYLALGLQVPEYYVLTVSPKFTCWKQSPELCGNGGGLLGGDWH
jgi:hypothetical protein